jgi:electron-transferring-flavoprotein dehydrogenase
MSAEREVLEVDVLFVGGGPANLACATHLAGLLDKHSEAGGEPGLDETFTVLIEKAKEIGFHSISGAVLDPRGLEELIPDYLERDCPLEAEVDEDELWFLTKGKSIKSFFTPSPLENRGLHVVSLGKLVRWLGGIVEETGRVELFPEFPGAELLMEDGKVVGVRTGDKGLDKDGNQKPTYEPGIDIRAKVTVLGEGARGSLTKVLTSTFDLGKDKNPQVYAVGIKELWKMPEGTVPPGRVYHTMGWPLDKRTFGGGFIYGMKDDVWDVGLVVGLDYLDPYTDPHGLFQKWKTHPRIRELLKGGKMIQYGAKALPEGGWFSRPRPYVDGCLVVGDSGSFLDPMRLKGIHLGMKSGMLAAETIFEALKEDDFSATSLSRYETKVEESWIATEMLKSRNIHQGFEKGLWRGLMNAGLGLITGGKGFGVKERLTMEPGHERIRTVAEHHGPSAPPFTRMKFDGELTFDRLSGVYESGTKHEEDQPVHLKVSDTGICRTKCRTEYANPCTRFCPAEVYEMEEVVEGKGPELKINASNCVHCKTCDIMDPYQIITWVTPEGGGGPRYVDL